MPAVPAPSREVNALAPCSNRVRACKSAIRVRVPSPGRVSPRLAACALALVAALGAASHVRGARRDSALPGRRRTRAASSSRRTARSRSTSCAARDRSGLYRLRHGALERDRSSRGRPLSLDAEATRDPGDDGRRERRLLRARPTDGRAGSSFGTACSSRRRTPTRSSAGITLDGLLDVRRVSFVGTWRGSGSADVLNF